ncbi:MAG TPA: hypothetical protein VHM64_24630, partial [Candidatus Binatia bacterium]|nr:hypothetical protein [Candidatus Binatia bacterium]
HSGRETDSASASRATDFVGIFQVAQFLGHRYLLRLEGGQLQRLAECLSAAYLLFSTASNSPGTCGHAAVKRCLTLHHGK